MRVPLSWLRELCATELTAEQVAEALTDQGVEVDRVIRPWEAVSGIVVARVLEVRDHPKADRLCLATIDAGDAEREVVVGVRNFAAGDVVPYAPPGARLPGLEGPLERREIRGQLSEGMLCSPKELGISADHSGILVLGDGVEPGDDFKDRLGLDEAVIDIEVPANRPDLLSVLGVAREVAARTGDELVPPVTEVPGEASEGAAVATVEVDDPVGCPRYLARIVHDVRLGASPVAAQVRLTAAGMRPVSNVVDATNYVMLELGQPMHPFDLALLDGHAIVVRRAEEGERLVTLDGIERALVAEDLVIADRQSAIAVAGVMGGASTEVSTATADVLLESAHFDPVTVRRTARRLGLRTEASTRFERGADPEAGAPAAARAAALIAMWSGGTVAPVAIDVGEPPPPAEVLVEPHRVSALLGVEVGSQEIREALGRLRIQAREEDEDVVVLAPSFRPDLRREVDVAEEVARVVGYGAIPSTVPGIRQAGGLTRDARLRRRVADLLSAAGLWEARSSSFLGASDLALFEDERRVGVRIENPISDRDDVLRTSLLPGLLRAAQRNVAQRRTSVRIFEIGHTFVVRESEAEEIERVAVLLAGPRAEEWPQRGQDADFLDAKGVLEHLLEGLGIGSWSLSQFAFAPFHPARSTEVILPGEPPIGELAELHPRVAEAFDIPSRVAVFELRLDHLLAASTEEATAVDVSRFPPLHRDLAFVVDRDVPAGAVRDALKDAAGPLLDRVLLFDVYEGDPLPAGKKSLAFSVDFRADDRTLTDDEVETRVGWIAERLAADLGAELRTG